MRAICKLTLLSALGLIFPQHAYGQSETQDSRVTPCFSESNAFGCTLRADNSSKKKENSDPASFAYTANNDDESDDSFAIMAALKIAIEDNNKTYGLKTQWHKNNQQSKEQDNFTIGASYGLTFSNVTSDFLKWVAAGKPASWETNTHTHYLDFDLAYNRKAIFGDEKADACVADMSLKACNRQNLETLRLSGSLSPWWSNWEHQPKSENEAFWSFAPTISVFVDEALNGNVETLSGKNVNGSVTGVMGNGSLFFSPSMFDYKWGLTLSGQLTQTVSRNEQRKEDFPESSPLFSVSLDYALGGTYVGQKDKNTFLPAIGITYTNGADPLNGKEDQDTLVLGFKLKY